MKKIVIVESIIIVLLAFIIVLLSTPDPEQKNNSYAVSDYEYLNVSDYRELLAYEKNTKGYGKEFDYLWKNSQILLGSLYNKEENIPSEIKIDEKNCRIPDNREFIENVSEEDIITYNVSVIDVMIYNDKAIVSFVYDLNLSDKNGELKYHDNAHYSSPYKLCLEKDNESSQWSVDRILIPA